MIGRFPVEEQLEVFRAALSGNKVLMEVMSRAAALDLPGWYLTAGCLFQTVWNVLTASNSQITGASMRPTASPASSILSFDPIPYSLLATSMRPRPNAGLSAGPNSPSCLGRISPDKRPIDSWEQQFAA
jgi:hypothetical protein